VRRGARVALTALVDVSPHFLRDFGTQHRFADIAEYAKRHLARVLLAPLDPQDHLRVLPAAFAVRDSNDVESRVFGLDGFIGDPRDIGHAQRDSHESACGNECAAGGAHPLSTWATNGSVGDRMCGGRRRIVANLIQAILQG